MNFDPNGEIYILFAASKSRVIHQTLLATGLWEQYLEALSGLSAEELASLNADPAYKRRVITKMVDETLDGDEANGIDKTYVFHEDTYVNNKGLSNGFVTVQGVDQNSDGSYRLALSVNLAQLFPNEEAFKIKQPNGTSTERHANGFVDVSEQFLLNNGMLQDVQSYLADIEEGLEDGTIHHRDSSLAGRLVLARREELDGERGFALRDMLFNRTLTSTTGELVSGLFLCIAPPQATQNELSRRINYISIQCMSVKTSSTTGAKVVTAEQQAEVNALFGVSWTPPAVESKTPDKASEAKIDESTATGTTATARKNRRPTATLN